MLQLHGPSSPGACIKVLLNFSQCPSLSRRFERLLVVPRSLSSLFHHSQNEATLPSAVKPTGSQKPTGACTPSSFSNARKGDSV
eukprot:5627962-Amphidinium_carterae.1